VRDPASDPCADDTGDGARGGGPLFRRRLDHRPSTELPGTRLRVLRVFVSDLLPRLCAAASAHVGAWRVVRRGRLLSALVMAVSAIGHLSSSLLLRVGVPIWANVAAAFGFFALSGFAVYGNVLPPQGISLVAALALGIGGLAPGAIYAAAPHAAPAPSAVPPTSGWCSRPAVSVNLLVRPRSACGSSTLSEPSTETRCRRGDCSTVVRH
jgi:hypothetical protein